MKRTGYLRTDPVKVRAWLDRSRRPLRARSPRTGGNEIPAASRRAVEARSHGFCEARIDGCHGRATHMHHIAARRGRDHSPENLLHVCAFDGVTIGCHERIHASPVASRALGHMKRVVA